MNRPDNVKMEISIAGERIFLTVPFSQQDNVRDTERSVEKLYTTWRREFPAKTTTELLAMMAYQYASFYNQLLARVDEAKELAAGVAERLDSLIDADEDKKDSIP